MHQRSDHTTVMLPPELLRAVTNTALFYPCCGQDLRLPIRLFASAVSDFYFVDIRRPHRPRVGKIARLESPSRRPEDADNFVHHDSGNEFRVHRWQNRGETVLHEMPELGVFFFRGDNPANGEGSSGVLWLGEKLLSRILALLVPDGFVVTDGSNSDPDGPEHLSRFYHNYDIGHEAISEVAPFDYEGRRFTCVGYAGERYGPTLIWRVA